MNRLKVSLQQTIIALTQRGWSQRRIARELGIDRETVKRYAPAAKPATNPTAGSLPGPPSLCEAHRAVIEAALERGLTAQRIHQDLRSEQGFTGSYESVKRFVRRVGAAMPLPFRRMECSPGEEVQVDFGQGAWIEADGKRRRPHLFRAVLSHSRKGYSEAVWRQDTETFIRCCENAYRDFGGVPRTTVVDNLKAAVLDADWFDPNLNPKMAEFAKHYGTTVLPTQPARPEHKGQDRGRREVCPEQRAQGAHVRIFGRTKSISGRLGAPRR